MISCGSLVGGLVSSSWLAAFVVPDFEAEAIGGLVSCANACVAATSSSTARSRNFRCMVVEDTFAG
jgi:hypothetical protein